MSAVVSFCISTYNRCDMVVELVNHLLDNNRDDIEVVVVDNNSFDCTVVELKKIIDSRLFLYVNKENVGGKRNWYEALSKGKGKWLFQLNDRDYINTNYLSNLIESLKILEASNVGFAVGGEVIGGEGEQLFDEGYETLNEFALRDSHPTGQIIRRDVFEKIQDKEKYFSEDYYGVYPHGFLYAEIGQKYKGAYLCYDICDKANYAQRVASCSQSMMYDNNTKIDDKWFMPNNRFHLLILAMEHVCTLNISDVEIQKFIVNKYIRFFNKVTYEFYSVCNNYTLKRRYSCEDLQTNYLSIIANAYDYSLSFREYLENQDYYWKNDKLYETINRIDLILLEGLYSWSEEIRRNTGDNK